MGHIGGFMEKKKANELLWEIRAKFRRASLGKKNTSKMGKY